MHTNAIHHQLTAASKRLGHSFLFFYFSIFLFFYFSPTLAQIGTWKNYLAYHDVQQIQAAGDDLFVLASGNLYQYNKQDHSITTYDKVNGLSDTGIDYIRWNALAKRLVIVYSNSNIDLIDTDGNVTNISDIYSKAITGDKTIYGITISSQYAYLSCGFGIVRLDVGRAEISESYMLGFAVKAVTLDDANLYALSADRKIWKGPLASNLIDKANWTETTASPSFAQDTSDYDQHIALVKTLKPGGPKYNYFHQLQMHDGRLYTVGGGWYQFDNFHRPGTIQVMDADNNWTIYQDDITPAFASAYRDVNSLAIDPRDEGHVMVAACSGVYEFQNGQFVANYTAGNTDYFQSADIAGNSPDYVRVDGIIYDRQGNMYCLNSASASAIIRYSNSHQWSAFMHDALEDEPGRSMRVMKGTIIDSRGLIWFANAHSDNPALFCYQPDTEKLQKYNTFVNQDGTAIANVNLVNCISEDKEGNIWIGTDAGPLYLTADEISNPARGFIQHKVPRNDGTNYADYLLTGVNITSIAIDEANRKWLGTENNGAYLISADNNSQVQHFTAAGSCLLDDNIESIAINHASGEVFFGTGRGLCSYMGDATTVSDEMTDGSVYAYPNPVTPDYTGLITIVGLTMNADVKILNASGKLMAQGRSNGGTFTWDGCDQQGRRVASGVYMVAVATSEGKKGTMCKIAIVR